MPVIRRIVVPTEITLVSPDTGEVLPPAPAEGLPNPLPFALFVRRALRSPVFARKLDAVRSGLMIGNAVGKPGEAFEQPALVIADEDWRVLRDAIDEPVHLMLHPAILPQLLPYFDAILNAELTTA